MVGATGESGTIAATLAALVICSDLENVTILYLLMTGDECSADADEAKPCKVNILRYDDLCDVKVWRRKGYCRFDHINIAFTPTRYHTFSRNFTRIILFHAQVPNILCTDGYTTFLAANKPLAF